MASVWFINAVVARTIVPNILQGFQSFLHEHILLFIYFRLKVDLRTRIMNHLSILQCLTRHPTQSIDLNKSPSE